MSEHSGNESKDSVHRAYMILERRFLLGWMQLGTHGFGHLDMQS